MKKIKNVPLHVIIIVIVVFATMISLGASGMVLQQVIEQNEKQTINLRLKSIAQIAASDPIVIRGLMANTTQTEKKAVQSYATSLTQTTKIDFVVVLNKQLIRLSHPDTTEIGKKFSSPQDAQSTLNGVGHFSTKVGILGLGYRYFAPVYDANHHVIGVISVGLTEDTISRAITTARRPIVVGLAVGLSIGVVGSWLLAKILKKILLNMEPQVIAKKLVEKTTIENSMMEGLIAIDEQNHVIDMNRMAKDLLPQLGAIGERLADDIHRVFFIRDAVGAGRAVFNDREFIYSVTALDYPAAGAVALFRDITDLRGIVAELDGTKQYAQALRAQTHEFMNKLQAISGLIELKKYDDVTNLVPQLTSDYQANVGYMISRIKMPVVAGFLIGKINYAREKSVTLKICEASRLPDICLSGQEVTNMIKIIGNIIDNAIDAVIGRSHQVISLLCQFDDKKQTVIIEIKDKGIGMTPSQLEVIREAGVSTKGNNRGYGLSIVNDIISAHNGVFQIESTIDVGTRLYIVYPIHVEENK